MRILNIMLFMVWTTSALKNLDHRHQALAQKSLKLKERKHDFHSILEIWILLPFKILLLDKRTWYGIALGKNKSEFLGIPWLIESRKRPFLVISFQLKKIPILQKSCSLLFENWSLESIQRHHVSKKNRIVKSWSKRRMKISGFKIAYAQKTSP